MGFGQRWIKWAKGCISTPLLTIIVNGSPTPQFGLERGLRQGDPLSPFHFNLVVEGLSALFRKVHDLNMIKGASFGNNEIYTSHLKFTDDTALFLEPNLETLRNSRRILKCFELSSGLKINFHKSCVVGIRKSSLRREEWASYFKCKLSSFPFNYLGRHLGAKPSTKVFWKDLISWVESRLAL
ncbi:hypothetical protein Ddye_014295 [Dipteronia dyeriana]|uniref:Reverse transcriptase domain-containing protein n=1 Tax=Dipteronia dyeriana TaxID=168575 RepID=A0AAD9X7V0_9ROSI|nr:hypothetical protein Ddye_014295 [Dipteronia dyeriana]